MTHPNPNNPSPEMIEAGRKDCERMLPHEQFDAVEAALANAMQAQQPNPSPADELSDNKLVEPDRYDAGLLGDGGGGDVDWWQDYIRAELERAHEYYSDQAATALTTLQARLDAMREALDVARKQIVEITCDGTNRLREVGYEADPPERTYIPALDRIDEALAKDGEV